MFKSICAAAATAAAMLCAAFPANAATKYLTFSGNGFAGVNQFSSSLGINSTQQPLLDAFYNVGGPKPFSVTFSYDTAAVPSGGRFAADLVSATANGTPNIFSGFSLYLQLANPFGNVETMDFWLTRSNHGATGATTVAQFGLQNFAGTLFDNALSLPTAFGSGNNVNVSIRTTANGRFFEMFGSGGFGASDTPPPGSVVPEPAAWALMIMSFL